MDYFCCLVNDCKKDAANGKTYLWEMAGSTNDEKGK